MGEVEAASSLFDVSGQDGDFLTGISSPVVGESSEQSHVGTVPTESSESPDIYQQLSSGSSGQDDFFSQVGTAPDGTVPVVDTKDNPSHSGFAQNATQASGTYGVDFYDTQKVENSEEYYTQGTTDSFSQWEQYSSSQYSSYDNYQPATHYSSSNSLYSQPSSQYTPATTAQYTASQHWGEAHSTESTASQSYSQYGDATTYDPYKPPSEYTSPSVPTVIATSNTPSTYSPYSAPDPVVSSPYGPASYNNASSSSYSNPAPPRTAQETTASPRPAADHYRPKSYNAYDPPIPARKTPRQASTGQYSTGSSAYSSSLYTTSPPPSHPHPHPHPHPPPRSNSIISNTTQSSYSASRDFSPSAYQHHTSYEKPQAEWTQDSSTAAYEYAGTNRTANTENPEFGQPNLSYTTQSQDDDFTHTPFLSQNVESTEASSLSSQVHHSTVSHTSPDNIFGDTEGQNYLYDTSREDLETHLNDQKGWMYEETQGGFREANVDNGFKEDVSEHHNSYSHIPISNAHSLIPDPESSSEAALPASESGFETEVPSTAGVEQIVTHDDYAPDWLHPDNDAYPQDPETGDFNGEADDLVAGHTAEAQTSAPVPGDETPIRTATQSPDRVSLSTTQYYTAPTSRTPSYQPEPVYDPYAPSNGAAQPLVPLPEVPSTVDNLHTIQEPLLNRGINSGGYQYAPPAASIDPYAPTSQSKNPPSWQMPVIDPPTIVASDVQGVHVQEVSYIPSATYAAYAPSPSLLGTNDPLERTKLKVPIVNFGFGGRLVVCFHNVPITDTGFDVAISSRKATDVQLRALHKLIPQLSPVSFPGPLFGDVGSPVAGIVRAGTSAQTKNRKSKVTKYLDDRIAEITQGLGYLTSGSTSLRDAENRLVLLRLLKVLVEHDGQLSGSSEVDTTVRNALLPHLESLRGSIGSSLIVPSELYSTQSSNGTFSGLQSGGDTIASYTVRSSSLDILQSFLYRGEKRQAYQYALDQQLWAHAMIIACSIDKDAFKEVVHEFIQAELGVKTNKEVGQTHRSHDLANGRESLRVAYSLFSGQSSGAALQELLPVNLLEHGGKLGSTPSLTFSHATPITPGFPSTVTSTPTPTLSIESLSKWAETVCAILGTSPGSDASYTLTALGDSLVANNCVEAAHSCYLLSPQTSPIGGLGSPGAKIMLLGSQGPVKIPTFHADAEPLFLSEILEFALSLRAPIKGQEAFGGFPHLQAYRLMHAWHLAEQGHTALAKRYCDAINACLSRPSPYLTTVLLEKHKELTNRLMGNASLDKGAWIGGRITKPSLDSIGDWLGGTLSKFVAGEHEGSSPSPEETTFGTKTAQYSSAFSHYSTISSVNPSARPSPNSSMINVGVVNSTHQMRSVSPEALRSTLSHHPIDRAASAMDHYRGYTQRSSPIPRVASANAADHVAASTASFKSSNFNGFSSHVNPISTGHASTGLSASGATSIPEEVAPSEPSWWSSTYGENSDGSTPTATTFFKVDAPSTSDGLVSLMDTTTPEITYSGRSSVSLNHQDIKDNDDDLGLGNSKRKLERQGGSEDKVEEAKENVGQPKQEDTSAKSDLAPSSSGSWFSRWWPKGSPSPGPVRANLGEETSFYYDKEQKKWVNKKVGAEASKPTPSPPPPVRAQTASPSRMQNPPNGPPVPVRPASVAELGSGPPKKPAMRIRSNLVPPDRLNGPPTPNTAPLPSVPGTPLPPGARPKSSASKRNVRSRYVDVFQNPE